MTKKSRRVARARRVLLSLSLVLVMMMVAVGGTIAWLTDKTENVTNTFSVGDIEITLHESPYDRETNKIDTTKETSFNDNYKIIPGTTMPKDPTVTVLAKSEASWLFVKVDVTNWPEENVTYAIDQAWTELTSAATDIKEKTTVDGQEVEKVIGTSKVYYRQVDATTVDIPYSVLKDDQIVVSENLNETQMAAVTTPKMVFTAYAIQQENVANAETAWSNINK